MFETSTMDANIFLAALGALRTWTNSSDRGVYYPLRKVVISNFTDADKAKERLQLISVNEAEPKMQAIASELLREYDESI